MFLKQIFLGVVGLSYGLIVSAGVFTVLVSVGLVPRFAGKTHTSKKILLYEEMVVRGTISGGLVSVFEPFLLLGKWVHEKGIVNPAVWQNIGNTFLGIYGIFAGIFVGCLALAVAEMLDSIPIFARRAGFRHGIGIAILLVAFGKLCGSFCYFWFGIH